MTRLRLTAAGWLRLTTAGLPESARPCCQGKREALYRDMWERAMDDMAEQLVFRSGDLRLLGGRVG